MACIAVMDLRPVEQKFVFSKKGKSATLLCSFQGKYKSEYSIQIELVISYRSGVRPLKETAAWLEKEIAAGNLLRVTGAVRRMLYQDRKSGEEIDRIRLYAWDICISAETDPIYSMVQMEGGVRKVSDSDIFKDTGTYRKVAFTLFCNPDTNFEQETYLSVYATGYNEVADKVNRLNLKEKSHVIAHGKFEATSFGLLGLKLYDLGYAKRPQTKKGEN